MRPDHYFEFEDFLYNSFVIALDGRIIEAY
jgi:hypothetical protein